MVEELAVATRVASEASERYHIVTNQCLWFALLIWNIICQVKAGEFARSPLIRMGWEPSPVSRSYTRMHLVFSGFRPPTNCPP